MVSWRSPVRIIRRPAVQGHAIPNKASYASNPFPVEILRPNPVVDVVDDTPSPYANAQNDYREPKYYRCRSCEEIFTEDEVDGHHCG
jgi:hypothetical protein